MVDSEVAINTDSQLILGKSTASNCGKTGDYTSLWGSFIVPPLHSLSVPTPATYGDVASPKVISPRRCCVCRCSFGQLLVCCRTRGVELVDVSL